MNIDKNIPVPESVGMRKNKYPFADMQVGDSVLVPGDTYDAHAAMAAYNAGKRRGWKFTARKVEGGTRIWRSA